MRTHMLILSLMLSACTYNDYQTTTTEKGKNMDFGSEIFNGNGPDEQVGFTGKSVSGTMICGDPKTLSLQAKFDAPGPHTVQFDLEPPAGRDILIGGVFSCEAIIEWSIAGNTLYRKVTVMDGMSITGNAESVVVRMIDTTTDIVFVGSTPPASYKVAATVTKGARATTAVPPVYIPNPAVTLVAGATSFNVPDNIGANSVMVLSSAPAEPDANSVFAEQRCSNALTGQLGRWDPYGPRFVPLDSNALIVRVTPNGAAATIKVIFGIDG